MNIFNKIEYIEMGFKMQDHCEKGILMVRNIL